MADDAVPESRAYRHQKCGSETEISGQPFGVLSNPLGDMAQTWCGQCNAMFPPSEYSWADTNESIPDYWARHSSKASSLDRYLCSRKFLLICFAVGFLAGGAGGLYLFRNSGVGAKVIMAPFCGVLGLMAATAVNISLISAIITKKVCGVSDTRVLK